MTAPKSWRDVIPPHPAADLFPMMTRDELIALGNDIKKNGLCTGPVLWEAQKGATRYLFIYKICEAIEIELLTDDNEEDSKEIARLRAEYEAVADDLDGIECRISDARIDEEEAEEEEAEAAS